MRIHAKVYMRFFSLSKDKNGFQYNMGVERKEFDLFSSNKNSIRVGCKCKIHAFS